MGKHKREPDIYLGFSLALHLQCMVSVLCTCLGHITFVNSRFLSIVIKNTIVDWDDFIFGLAEILQI
jgi:hypothetical protein